MKLSVPLPDAVEGWVKALEGYERELVHYDEDAPAGESPIGVLHGTKPVLISAPHSARHWREGEWKQEDEYTAAIGYLLHKQTGAHLIYARYQLNPDPHDDGAENAYKRALDEIVTSIPIGCVIDLHGARGDRDFAVAIGTMGGQTLANYEKTLIHNFRMSLLYEEADTPSLDRVAINPPRYTGGFKLPTITRHVWERHQIPAVQIELSAWVRITRRLENATNARNGTSPNFRGDLGRIGFVCTALHNFINDNW
ncbi:MAG: hypothetical protein U0528_14220 [Anaerolineae bacterium]|nr:hypothetical protein [Anaerolineae bacterium]